MNSKIRVWEEGEEQSFVFSTHTSMQFSATITEEGASTKEIHLKTLLMRLLVYHKVWIS